ncbi:ribonuclease P protein component [Candidatus Kaiserbacteria bacterium]|nr:MAG: ribonuclease P protein component [Candidatus Kaiserbacteria bacterium]
MLPKKQRANKAEVQAASKGGSTKHSTYFTLRKAVNKDLRVAVVVSKKVSPTAVGRNTLKRRVREVLRSVSFPTNATYIVYVKKNSQTLTPKEIKKEIQGLL